MSLLNDLYKSICDFRAKDYKCQMPNVIIVNPETERLLRNEVFSSVYLPSIIRGGYTAGSRIDYWGIKTITSYDVPQETFELY